MAYKTWGVIVEGIGIDSDSPSFYCGQFLSPSQYISLQGSIHKCVPMSVIDYPQTSASSFDQMTGEVRSGSATFMLTANDRLVKDFLVQAQATKFSTRLNLKVNASATQMNFYSNIPTGYYYIDQEVINVLSIDSGTTYNVTRGVGGTIAAPHNLGTSLYNKPSYWVGRRVQIVEAVLPDDLSPQPLTPTSLEVIWSGYLSAPPQLTNSTSKIKFQASSSYDLIYNLDINRNPLNLNKQPVTTVRYFYNVYVLSDLISNSYLYDGQQIEKTRVYKAEFLRDIGRVRAIQIQNSFVLIYKNTAWNPGGDRFKMFGKAMLGSKPLPETWNDDINKHEPLTGDNWELLVWDRQLDEDLLNTFGDTLLSPTIGCEYPYHPLTVALSMLVSTNDIENYDPANFDVLHRNWSLGIKDYIDLDVWRDMISKTSWMKIDRLILGWDGAKFKAWDFITTKLLPAFSLAIVPDNEGYLKPIQIGFADIESYANAEILAPLPNKWEWQLASGSPTHNLYATVGTLPWSDGQTVSVIGHSEIRDVSNYLNKDSSITFDWPFFNVSATTNLVASQLQDLLVWKYDGIPKVSFNLDQSLAQTLYLGDIVRLAKPSGLQSFLLLDKDGNRVDDWAAVPFITQITSIRPNIKNGTLECEGILINYGVSRLAKWRAPGVRIKARIGTAQYRVEGLLSDFDRPETDALTLTINDPVVLSSKTLGVKSSTVVLVNSIDPEVGTDDYIITLNADWGTIGAAGDWIVIATSPDYTNTNVVGSFEPYPYVFMTEQNNLPRPTSPTDPDLYA